ncbi:flagellar hook-basal body protein [Bacillus sp. FJAT-44742]|uniref:flagellar hook-basal body protein n=1 Tax=Bacillus sp. FJAT-44742 TaxID=2014005 RepID=UPI000C231A37|nr:flagellar hook-basal body protein [Bacillus sp. FJAT-44742]
MLRGFYGAAAGMITQQRRTEMLTENMANINTPGYKGDHASIRSFPEMMIYAQNTASMPPNQAAPIGALATGVYMQERTPNFAQGDLRETGNSTDIALLQGNIPVNEETGRAGALFFNVTNENGEQRYTRNGSWTVDGDGALVTAEGHYILGTDGNTINVGNEHFIVGENGVIETEEGINAGQIGVAFAGNPESLVRDGGGLYRLGEGEDELPNALEVEEVNFQLNQGFLEGANVDAAQTMTEMNSAFRTFEANQKVLQAYDQSMDKAVNEVGRLG